MKYITVKEAAKIFPYSEAAIRSLIFQGKFEGVYKKIGKRVVIDADQFNKWIEHEGNLPFKK